MKRIKYIFKILKRFNFKGMFETVDKVHKINHKLKFFIFCDMVWCGFRYLAGYMDYYIFAMYNLNGKQRKTVMTRGWNDKYFKKLNNKDYLHVLHNKNEFNEKFNKYLNRDWLFLRDDNEKDFLKFVKDKDYIIAKPQNGMCGKGIEKLKIADYKPHDLYKYLLDKNLLVLEEVIKQHHAMNKLHPNGVNSIRIITILKDNQVHIVASYMRIGNGRIVDNFNSGGMVVPVDTKAGIVSYPAVDKAINVYEEHPLTHVKIKGFKVPLWQLILTMVKKAAREIPELGIVGWDVGITEKGPLLIEANQFPGHDIYQLPPHTTNGIGMLPTFQAIMKIK